MKRIARVFPRKTKASPADALAYFEPPGMFAEADEVHVSVSFTWDMNHAEYLAEQWRHVAPVTMGGPAFNRPGAAFVPGQYVRPGYVITSRGCPNKCWFCSVWKREPGLIELPICDGTNVLDDNLLACSDRHIRDVFAMLKRQRGRRVEFSGGLEAARLQDWHIDLLVDLKPAQMFFALDTPDDEEPLRAASRKLLAAGFTAASHRLRCYVLIGHPKDTFARAEQRLNLCVELGFFPMAMLWRDDKGETKPTWGKFQRTWARPACIAARMRDYGYFKEDGNNE
jgi:hypothetical protein